MQRVCGESAWQHRVTVPISLCVLSRADKSPSPSAEKTWTVLFEVLLLVEKQQQQHSPSGLLRSESSSDFVSSFRLLSASLCMF